MVWDEQQVTIGSCHYLYLKLQFIGTGGARTRDAGKSAAVIARGKWPPAQELARSIQVRCRYLSPAKEFIRGGKPRVDESYLHPAARAGV